MSDSNAAALAALQARWGGTLGDVDLGKHLDWLPRMSRSMYEPELEGGRFLEAQRDGHRVAVLTDVAYFRVENIKGSVRATRRTEKEREPRQVVAVGLPGATVRTLFEAYTYPAMSSAASCPPHVRSILQPGGSQGNWTLDGQAAPTLPAATGFVFRGCHHGVLYALAETDTLDAGNAERAVDALLEAAKLPWRPPSQAEIAAAMQVSTRAASSMRGKAMIAVAVGVLVLGGVTAYKVLGSSKKHADRVDERRARADERADERTGRADDRPSGRGSPVSRDDRTDPPAAAPIASGATAPDRENIKSVMASANASFDACRADQRPVSPRLALVIQPDGRVSSAEIPTGPLAGTDAATCIAKVARGLTFEPWQGPEAKVTIPLKFE